LRRSQIPLSADAFASVLREGALVHNGMPIFGEISEGDRAAIRQYLRARGAESRKGS
jgi:quinohemoprotein ethanol dehydrogenase